MIPSLSDINNLANTTPNATNYYNTTPVPQDTSASDFVAGMAPYAGGFQDTGPTEAELAAAAARQASINKFNTGYQSIYDSVNSNVANKGIELGRGIRQSLAQMQAQQDSIDSEAYKNEVAKLQGTAGVQGMVGRGIKSSGVMLGNRNAGDSSAAGALASAYGQLGQREMAGIGNQYEMGNLDIANSQRALGKQRDEYQTSYGEDKQMYINGLVAEAQAQFNQLNADAESASIPQRIAIDQEKEKVRQQLIGTLQQYDSTLQAGLGGIQAKTADQRRATANEMMSRGTDLGAGAFNFTAEAPMGFQGGAPAGGNLPLYTLPRKRMA